jgi:hypothetical protein
MSVTVFVDGSWYMDRKTDCDRAGAGVYFDAPAKLMNRAVPVPGPKDGSVGSALRSELYAALLSLHMLSENGIFSLRVVIKQDCQSAHLLLRTCTNAALPKLAPSRWIKETAEGKEWKIVTKWGDTLDAKVIERHSDILDAWWVLSYAYDVRFEWVKAHAPQQETKDWEGNDIADRMAKAGATESARDKAYWGLPLFPKETDCAPGMQGYWTEAFWKKPAKD